MMGSFRSPTAARSAGSPRPTHATHATRSTRSTRERGSVVVDLVGFTPVFLLIVLALVQGVIGISGIDAINKAARDGARAAAVGSSYNAVDLTGSQRQRGMPGTERTQRSALFLNQCAAEPLPEMRP